MKIILFANTFEYFSLRINFLKKLRNNGFDIYLLGTTDKLAGYGVQSIKDRLDKEFQINSY